VGLTIVLELFDRGYHLAVQLPCSGMVSRAVARAVVMSKMIGIRPITNRPLCSLLNGEETKGAIALP
jgi:hypothetical protein